MITAISTAVVNHRSPVVSRVMKIIVSGPPMTETESAPIPMIA
jgi:hypothetical protein